MTYRPDIDGLRAIAVIAVILCHLNESWLPGGFLGVDMFFVISGFLIGGIIYREASAGNFSWKQFYLRRMRRILPAFFGVVICCLIVGACIFVPHSIEWGKASGSSIWGLPFASNIFLARNTSYFTIDSKTVIFNHLWSLSIEEQFYFIYPIILIALIKFTPSWLLKVFNNKKEIVLCLILIAFTLLSFSLVFVPLPACDIYYMPHVRFGELIIGAILAIWMEPTLKLSTKKVNANIIAGVSAVVLLVCLIRVPFPERLPWFPGIASSIPCIATAGIIYAGFQRNAVSRFLSLKPIVFVGRISYSLYLWHWPILAFTRYLRITEPTNEVKLIVVALTVIFSLLSYYFIEQPLRHRQWNFSRTFLLYYVTPSLAVLGIILYNAKSLDEVRNSTKITWSTSKVDYVRAYIAVGDSTKQPDVLFLGNSHTRQLYDFYNTLGKKEGWSGYLSGVGGEYPIDLDHKKAMSEQQYEELLKQDHTASELNELRSKRLLTDLPRIKTVVIAMDWWILFPQKDVISSINFFQKKGKQVIFLISCMHYDNSKITEAYYRKYHPLLLSLFNKEIPVRGERYNYSTKVTAKTRQKFEKLFPNIRCVDLSTLIPNDLVANGEPVLFDVRHLNDFGAKYIAEQFIKSNQRLIPASDSTTHCREKR